MRTSAVARLVIMGVLLVALLIPLNMVQAVVRERAGRRGSVVAEVSSTWGGAQTIGGPVLMVPYRYTVTDHQGNALQRTARAFFLPEALDIQGTMDPQVLERGLFEVVVYNAHLTITGRFVRSDFTWIRPAPVQPLWEEATLSIGVADPRGIARRVALQWNGGDVALAPGVEDAGLFASGLRAAVKGLSTIPDGGAIPFSFELDVNGSHSLRVLPGGSETSLQLRSPWPHPSFVGAPLPTSRETNASGFTGRWSVPYFGRGYPARWTNLAMDSPQLKSQAEASAIGVVLFQPVDIYQQAERAVKYAALFIVMTFVVFFVREIMRSVLLHPIQYSFVGFAMCVFYLLLVSMSEHIGFDLAYLAAAVATTGLIAVYSGYVLGGLAEAVLVGSGLSALYGFLYMLLRLEDYALVAGSVGLFVMLALVMYSTRRINWYELRLGGAKPPIISNSQ